MEFGFSLPLARPEQRGAAVFVHAGRSAVAHEAGGIDHQPLQCTRAGGMIRERAQEHTEPPPTDDRVVERPVRTVGVWRLLPPRTVPDDMDDAADHPPIIHPVQAPSAANSRAKRHIGERDSDVG